MNKKDKKRKLIEEDNSIKKAFTPTKSMKTTNSSNLIYSINCLKSTKLFDCDKTILIKTNTNGKTQFSQFKVTNLTINSSSDAKNSNLASKLNLTNSLIKENKDNRQINKQRQTLINSSIEKFDKEDKVLNGYKDDQNETIVSSSTNHLSNSLSNCSSPAKSSFEQSPSNSIDQVVSSVQDNSLIDERSSNLQSSHRLVYTKKKKKKVVKRNLTNSRERWRQQNVNDAFLDLRKLGEFINF